MKIYLAGVPGGNQIDRERELFDKFSGLKRLISYFYDEAGRITINEGILLQNKHFQKKKNSKK